jgi:hypothetical protein
LDYYRINKVIYKALRTELGAGVVAQVVQCLPTKSEALSSNTSTAKKKKKKKKKEQRLACSITELILFSYYYSSSFSIIIMTHYNPQNITEGFLGSLHTWGP